MDSPTAATAHQRSAGTWLVDTPRCHTKVFRRGVAPAAETISVERNQRRRGPGLHGGARRATEAGRDRDRGQRVGTAKTTKAIPTQAPCISLWTWTCPRADLTASVTHAAGVYGANQADLFFGQGSTFGSLGRGSVTIKMKLLLWTRWAAHRCSASCPCSRSASTEQTGRQGAAHSSH